jgi:hypothetical protein
MSLGRFHTARSASLAKLARTGPGVALNPRKQQLVLGSQT